MKNIQSIVIAIGLALTIGACLIEETGTASEEAAVTTPEEGVIAPCPPDMPPSYCDTGSDPGGGGAGGGGSGGGSGGGGGSCTPGTPGCSGPVNCPVNFRWNTTLQRCVSNRYGESCVGSAPADWICRVTMDGTCVCNPPPCSAWDPCPPPLFAPTVTE